MSMRSAIAAAKRNDKRQRLTFRAAIELLIEAQVIASDFDVGTNDARTEINIAAGGIDARKDGFFRRPDVCRLIGYARI